MKYFLLVIILFFVSCKKEEQSKIESPKTEDKKTTVKEAKPKDIEKKEEIKKATLPKPQLSLLDAVKAGNLEEVKRNLHHNPKPVKDNETEYKEHPFLVAVIDGNEAIVKELLSVYSANCKAKGGVVPLVAAVIRKNTSVVKVLVDYNAEIDAFDPSEMTALYMASARGDIEIVEYLCEKGADINKVNKFSFSHKETALGIAIKNERWKVANFLKKKGAKQYKDLK